MSSDATAPPAAPVAASQVTVASAGRNDETAAPASGHVTTTTAAPKIVSDCMAKLTFAPAIELPDELKGELAELISASQDFLSPTIRHTLSMPERRPADSQAHGGELDSVKKKLKYMIVPDNDKIEAHTRPAPTDPRLSLNKIRDEHFFSVTSLDKLKERLETKCPRQVWPRPVTVSYVRKWAEERRRPQAEPLWTCEPEAVEAVGMTYAELRALPCAAWHFARASARLAEVKFDPLQREVPPDVPPGSKLVTLHHKFTGETPFRARNPSPEDRNVRTGSRSTRNHPGRGLEHARWDAYPGSSADFHGNDMFAGPSNRGMGVGMVSRDGYRVDKGRDGLSGAFARTETMGNGREGRPPKNAGTSSQSSKIRTKADIARHVERQKWRATVQIPNFSTGTPAEEPERLLPGEYAPHLSPIRESQPSAKRPRVSSTTGADELAGLVEQAKDCPFVQTAHVSGHTIYLAPEIPQWMLTRMTSLGVRTVEQPIDASIIVCDPSQPPRDGLSPRYFEDIVYKRWGLGRIVRVSWLKDCLESGRFIAVDSPRYRL